jgi:triosephosphate isomerase
MTMPPARRDPCQGPLIGTNVKMTMTPSQTRRYLQALRPLVSDVTGLGIFVLTAFPALAATAAVLAGSNIAWGAQDVHFADRGPHTGDVSAPMLADLGCTYVLVGHFERRRDHAESTDLIRAKVQAAQRSALVPVLCIGEPARVSREVAIRQVSEQLGALRGADANRIVIAYEPGWAIGLGAAPAPAPWLAALHGEIRQLLSEYSPEPEKIPVISGGSVDLDYAPGLFRTPDVDGLFVGRKALDPGMFSTIIHSVLN